MAIIQGAGGKKKKQRKPKEEPNSLASTAVAEVLDVVSEGEILGLVDGLKSVYLDGTPLQNSDNTFNFKNVFVDTRVGTQAQTYIPRFSNLETTTVVNTKVTVATPVTRTITNTAVNAAEIVLYTPALFEQKSNGDVVGTSVQIAIDLNSNGGGFVQKILHTITGKTNSKYQRAFVLGMTGSPPWQIRVRRVTADSGVGTLQNDIYWDFYTEIVDLKLAMPNTASIGMSVDASQFDSIPVRAYDLKGLKVKIPNNYNPTTRVYTGNWSGTFTVGWTDNPAWCFYDMLTNGRYGAGDFIAEAAVDKFELYAIAQYCDQLVPNGAGGTEPRFTCNLYLQQQGEAYEVLTNMASIFRGMLYWANGTLIPVQDAPGTPLYLFTNANVLEGNFEWSGSALNARHTVALVAWNDPTDFYQQKIEAVEDLDGIARYGVRETRTVAVGCTSRGQAFRVGKWLLDSERNETETVSFRTAMEGAMVQPGSLIEIADQHRAGRRYGGRIISATLSQVQVDAPLTDLPSGTFVLAVMLPDGTEQERTVASINGTLVNVTAPFTAIPDIGSIWVLIAPNLSPIAARIVSISQEDDGTYAITALRHDTTKYARVELNLLVPQVPTTLKPVTPGVVTSITLSTYTFSTDAINRRVLRVSWVDTQRNVLYRVSVRRDSGEWVEQPVTPGNMLELYDVAPGVWEAQVMVINAINLNSAPVQSAPLTISTGTDITAGAIGSPEIGDNAILDRSIGNLNRDNLIPNPASELGAAAVGVNPEGNALIADAVNSYNGGWCRRLTFGTTEGGVFLTRGGPGTTQAVLTSPTSAAIPSFAGDEFYFEAFVKVSAAVASGTVCRFYMLFANATGGYTAGQHALLTIPSTSLTTSYQKFAFTGTLPAATTGVWIWWTQQSVAGDAGKFLYVDGLYMRRVIESGQIGGNAVLDRSLANTNRDNLIPNPNSELGTDAVGADPEGNGLVNDAGNAYSGQWIRRLTFGTTATGIYLTKSTQAIPAMPGDGFYFECYVKSSASLTAGTVVRLQLRWANSAGVYAGASQIVTLASTQVTISYQRYSVTGNVPAGSTGVWAYIEQQSVAGDSGKFLHIDALYMRRLVETSTLDPTLRASVNSSFYCDFSDVSNWMNRNDAPGATFVSAADANAVFGGYVGVATGQVVRVWRHAIPFDDDTLYRITARVKQVSDPSAGTKQISIGMLSYADDDDSAVNGNLTDNAWYAALTQTQTVAQGYITYVGYVLGRSASGSTAPRNNPASPGFVNGAARYIRPVIQLGYNSNTNTNGVQHIDQFTIETIANPTGWINTGNVTVDAISARVSAGYSGAGISITSTTIDIVSATITTTGGPILIWADVQSFIVVSGTNPLRTTEFGLRRDTTDLLTPGHHTHQFGLIGTFASNNTSTATEALTWLETPAAGTYTYKLRGRGFTTSGAGDSSHGAARITVLELKR